MQVFSVVASMGVGSYWVAMAFLAALILHLYTCRRFDRPMRALSRAMRQVTEGDFSVRVKPFHSENKFDYMDIMFEDFNRMAQELGSTETMKNDFIANVSHEIRTPLTVRQQLRVGARARRPERSRSSGSMPRRLPPPARA